MKKKYFVSRKDKKDWEAFTKQIGNISPKTADIFPENAKINKLCKLDLHGHSLVDSNKLVKKFIINSFNHSYQKLLIITGKGLRSKAYENPYVSKKLSILKNSVPEYIKNEESLNKKILKISKAHIKDGGEGGLYIYLKK